MKQYKQRQLDSILVDLEGPLSEAIALLQRLEEKYAVTHTHLRLVVDTDGDRRELFFVGSTLETDKEEQDREAGEKIRAQREEERERRQLAELKKKYENA